MLNDLPAEVHGDFLRTCAELIGALRIQGLSDREINRWIAVDFGRRLTRDEWAAAVALLEPSTKPTL